MLAIVTVLLSGIFLYRYSIQQALYKENSAHLLATYTQVNRTFTLFAQRNWNVLSDWDANLQYITDSGNIETAWREFFANRKAAGSTVISICSTKTVIILTASDRKGTADSIRNVFQKMYASGQAVISDCHSQQRKA